MEAIKCPNCGSEKIQELTEEKYVCLACDNVFLVHNLSKEFRQTDAHITDVHEDLSKKLDSINVNLQSVEVAGNTDNTKAKEVLFEAEQALQEGKFLESYVLFKKYTAFAPDSYVGYEGMFRALTNDYKDDAGEYKSVTEGANIYDCLLDGTDVLKKALDCDDADKESILSKFEQFYNRSAETLKRVTYGTEEEIQARKEKEKENAIFQHEQRVMEAEKKVKYIAWQIENAKSDNVKVAEFNKLSESEKKRAVFKDWIPFIIVLVLSVVFWRKMGLLLHIVDVIALIATGFWGLVAKPEEVSEDELNQKQQDLKEAEAALEELKKRDVRKELEEMNTEDFANQEGNIEKFTRLICKNSVNIITADELCNKYSELETPSDKAVYDVILEGYGANVAGPINDIIYNEGGFKLNSSMNVPLVAMRRVSRKRALSLAEKIEIAEGKARVCVSDDKKYFVVIKKAQNSISDETRIEFELAERHYSYSSAPQVVFETSDLDKAKRCKARVEIDTKGKVEIM